jgi:hypothetical protein
MMQWLESSFQPKGTRSKFFQLFLSIYKMNEKIYRTFKMFFKVSCFHETTSLRKKKIKYQFQTSYFREQYKFLMEQK